MRPPILHLTHSFPNRQDDNIYLTYQNDNVDKNCLIRWKPDGTGAEFMTGGNSTLCSGTPHGLKITTEGDTQYLYHANNNQKLTKTTLDGTIIWQVNGLFGQDTHVSCIFVCSGSPRATIRVPPMPGLPPHVVRHSPKHQVRLLVRRIRQQPGAMTSFTVTKRRIDSRSGRC